MSAIFRERALVAATWRETATTSASSVTAAREGYGKVGAR
jgi:hypothetical protein